MRDEIVFIKRSLDLNGKDAKNAFRGFLETNLEAPEDAFVYVLKDKEFKLCFNNSLLLDDTCPAWVSRNNSPVAFITIDWPRRWVHAVIRGLRPEIQMDIIEEVLSTE